MIQRIQSFWLVLALCCMVLCFMFPVAKYYCEMSSTHQRVEAQLDLVAKDNPEMVNQLLDLDPVVVYTQKASGFQTWPLIVVNLLVAALALVCIFLYKNRVLQMRLVAVAFLLNVVYVFLLFFWAVDKYGDIVWRALDGDEMQVAWFVGAYAPIVSIVFFVLAHRAIKRDEEKVRAADRLR
ncbi:MAG: DUF4293 domain-containing protein [Bacteroidales bacterium]|nr:DUF4293 domain-containing protein [Bacteroidales bacterium]